MYTDSFHDILESKYFNLRFNQMDDDIWLTYYNDEDVDFHCSFSQLMKESIKLERTDVLDYISRVLRLKIPYSSTMTNEQIYTYIKIQQGRSY